MINYSITKQSELSIFTNLKTISHTGWVTTLQDRSLEEALILEQFHRLILESSVWISDTPPKNNIIRKKLSVFPFQTDTQYYSLTTH